MQATYVLYLIETIDGRTRRIRELERFDDAAVAWRKHDTLLSAGVDVDVDVEIKILLSEIL
jgi:hypothetical protein